MNISVRKRNPDSSSPGFYSNNSSIHSESFRSTRCENSFDSSSILLAGRWRVKTSAPPRGERYPRLRRPFSHQISAMKVFSGSKSCFQLPIMEILLPVPSKKHGARSGDLEREKERKVTINTQVRTCTLSTLAPLNSPLSCPLSNQQLSLSAPLGFIFAYKYPEGGMHMV